MALPFLAPWWSWTAWGSGIALLAVTCRRGGWAALLSGWCAGVAFNALTSWWIPETIERFTSYSPAISGWMFAGYCLLTGTQFAVFALVASALRKSAPVLAFPLVWVACELLWPHLFPWRFGHTQFRWTTLLQVAEWTGIHGVSFLMVWFAALVVALPRRHQPVVQATHRRSHIGLFLGVFAAVLLLGAWRVAGVRGELARRPTLRVALVQPAVRPWLSMCRTLSREVQDAVDLICWPESAVPRFLPLTAQDLKTLSGPRPLPDPGGHLLFGCSSRLPESTPEGPFLVSALLVDPQERIIGRYHKRTLMPFGEYIPFEKQFPFLHRFSAFGGRYIPGETDAPLVIPDRARLGVLICYEDLVARRARAVVNAGADILVNLTNDFWFGESAALFQHLQLASVRAVENRRYLLRCTTTGMTAIVSPTGEIVQQAARGEPAVLQADVQTLEQRTLHTRWGDWFAWACALGTLILGLMRYRRPAAGGRCT